MYVSICKNVLSTIHSLPERKNEYERKTRLMLLIEFIVKEIGERTC